MKLLPSSRQTLLFSATMAPEIKKLTEKFLSNPKSVSVDPAASPAETVEQFLVEVHWKKKQETLLKLIKQEGVENAFIFLNRKRDIDGLTSFLKQKGYAAAGLHGDMPQPKRTETLDKFKSDEINLLICSDVAARGLDIKGVSHVFNYDVPMSSDDYVHRIGRTGRAGQKGRAWMLASDSDDKFLEAIEKLIKKKLERVVLKEEKQPTKNTKKKTHKKPHDPDPNKDAIEGDSFGDDIPAFLR
jgi:superfamily II DNA/RNA helicase